MDENIAPSTWAVPEAAQVTSAPPPPPPFGFGAPAPTSAVPAAGMSTLHKWLIAAGVVVALAIVGATGGVLATRSGSNDTSTATQSSSSGGIHADHWTPAAERYAAHELETGDNALTHTEAVCEVGLIEQNFDTPLDFANATHSEIRDLAVQAVSECVD